MVALLMMMWRWKRPLPFWIEIADSTPLVAGNAPVGRVTWIPLCTKSGNTERTVQSGLGLTALRALRWRRLILHQSHASRHT